MSIAGKSHSMVDPIFAPIGMMVASAAAANPAGRLLAGASPVNNADSEQRQDKTPRVVHAEVKATGPSHNWPP